MNVDNFLRCVKMPLVFSRVAQAPFCQLFFEKYLYSNNCVHLFESFFLFTVRYMMISGSKQSVDKRVYNTLIQGILIRDLPDMRHLQY